MAPNQSDTDDWTLVSPPHSVEGSPTRSENNSEHSVEQAQEVEEVETFLEQQSEESNNSEENYSADDDDGLTEIDLNDEKDQSKPPNKSVRFRVCISKKDSDSRKRKSNCNQTKSRLKVISKTLQQQRQQQPQPQPQQTISVVDPNEQQCTFSGPSSFRQLNPNSLILLPGETSRQCSISQLANKLIRNKFGCYSLEGVLLCSAFFIFPLIVLLAAVLFANLATQEHSNNSMYFWRFANLFNGRNGTFNLVDVDPASHTYLQLKSLDEDIAECIMNESPELGKAEGGGEAQSRFYGKVSSKSANAFVHYKPFKGLVCYEHEMNWRRRFNKLKHEHDLDLRKVLKQARKRFTSEMLETYHPSLRFKLILNQLEYLDYIEQKRKDKALDRLKIENLELMRQLNKLKQEANVGHSGKGGGKFMSNTEVENLKLKQENDALKASLAEKAGTMYIKQSLELERCGRENNALKQFHYQVAQEVSKNLKQLNLHTIEATAILDDHKSLESQLSLTRGYLLRLGEEINNLVSRNKGLAQKLTDLQLLSNQTIRPAATTTSNQETVEADTMLDYYNHVVDVDEETGKPFTAEAQSEKRLSGYKSMLEKNHKRTLTTTTREGSGNTCPESKRGAAVSRERANWLMQRAKLRERLREGSGIDAIERQIDDLLQKSSKLSGHSSQFRRNKKHYYSPDDSRGRNYQEAHKKKKPKHDYHYYPAANKETACNYGNQQQNEGRKAFTCVS